ncbi:MAG: ribonuclease P protein component 4 [Candidatus Baldrarchaeota archaeon]
MRRKLDQLLVKDIARQRIELLFEMADKIYRQHPDLAQRYIDLARKIGMRCRVKIPRRLKRRICKHCKSFLIPGVNCRVRLRTNRFPHLVVTCLKCGRQMRYPYKIGGKSAKKV